MEKIVAGFLKPNLLPIALGAAAVACAGSGYLGWHLQGLRFEAYKGKVAQAQLKAKAQVAEVEHTTAAISQDTRDKGDLKQAQTRTIYKTIAQKVYVYVPPQAAPDGSIPLGAVRLHDYAVLAVDPPASPAPGEPIGAATGIDLPAFVGTVAGNYGVCHAYRNEAQTWRDWYAREFAAWHVAGR
jgi:hypothetical protein